MKIKEVDISIDIRRKWDKKIIKEKFGENTPENFISFWIADMDFKHDENLKKDLIEYISNNTLGYTSIKDEFYDSIIKWHQKKHKVFVSKYWINLAYGTVSILHILNQAFLKEKDYIMTFTPTYEPFYTASKNNNRKFVSSKLLNKNGRYYIDFEDLEYKMKLYSPKIFILCNPHNPSGRVWTRKEIENIAELCLKYKAILVSDEVHSEIVFKEFTPTLSLKKEYLDNLIMLTSPNKAFNLGGLKTSYSIIPNNNIRKRLKKAMVKNSVTSPNILGLIALISSYNKGEEWLETVKEYIYNNYILLVDYIKNNKANIEIFEMESSYLLWLNVAKLCSSEKLIANLVEKGILVESGGDFIENAEDCIRINLGTSRYNILKFIEALEDF